MAVDCLAFFTRVEAATKIRHKGGGAKRTRPLVHLTSGRTPITFSISNWVSPPLHVHLVRLRSAAPLSSPSFARRSLDSEAAGACRGRILRVRYSMRSATR